MKLLYRTRDYAFIISAMGKLFPAFAGQVVTLFAFAPAQTARCSALFPDRQSV